MLKTFEPSAIIIHSNKYLVIIHDQPALTKFGRYKQFTIDSVVYWLGNEVDRWYIYLQTRQPGQ